DWADALQVLHSKSDTQKKGSDTSHSYDRLKEIIAYGARIDMLDRPDISSYVNRGLGTAIKTMWKTIEAIPRVYEATHGHTISRIEFEQIAQNSLPMLMHLASGNLERVVPLLELLSETSATFNIDYFMLQGTGEKTGMTMTSDAFQLKTYAGTEVKDIPLTTPTIGCAGLFEIRDVWNWVIGIAEQTYFPVFN
ncbi:MAG: hypothetical protein KGJ07_09505, partial [Patescibacteria group bacterium]|nr:hypothetical protein [Patescibacteria group bacterium]